MIKKETYKLWAFADNLVLFPEDPLKGIVILMDKFKEFGALAGFKINKQKMKKLMKRWK